MLLLGFISILQITSLNTGCQEPFPDLSKAKASKTELPMFGHEMVRDHRVEQ